MWLRILYYLIMTIGLAATAWLVDTLGKEKTERMKTSKCLKCSNGTGYLFNIDKGKRKASYKCDNCKSTWVEGF